MTDRADVAPIDLRPATAEDAPAVADIWFHGWRDGHLGHVPDEVTEIRHEQAFHERAPKRVGDTTVATLDGAVAGFVMVVGDEVEQVYVAATHRGSGIAAALLAEAERQVRADGHGHAWLAVVSGNRRARAFYEREGWVDHGLFHYVPEGLDIPLDVPTHRYVKEV